MRESLSKTRSKLRRENSKVFTCEGFFLGLAVCAGAIFIHTNTITFYQFYLDKF